MLRGPFALDEEIWAKFTLRQLGAFVAVAQQESVSRAAEGLSLLQSAINTSLGGLERQFDCKLFDRAGKRLALNALGRQLLPQTVAPLDRGEEIEDLPNGKTAFGFLDLGATLTIGNYLAMLLVGVFIQCQLDCRMCPHVHNTVQVVQQVTHYELDLGLIEGDHRHLDAEVQPWMGDGLVVFCAPQHPLAWRGDADLGRLIQEAWILREQGSDTRLTFDQAIRRHSQPLSIRLELGHTEVIKRAVGSGLGTGRIPRLALRNTLRRGSLVPVETPGLDLRRQFHLIWHKQKYQTVTMREFLDLCRSETVEISRSDETVLLLIP